DNFCSLTWTPGGKKWLLPSGVACDPGVIRGAPGGGDPLKYPGDQPDAPPGRGNGIDRPENCPPERWVPPSPQNLYNGRCLHAAPPRDAVDDSPTSPPVAGDGGTTLPPAPGPQP